MYYPVLRWKGGEKTALTHIPITYLDSLVPVWLFPPEIDLNNFFLNIGDIWNGKSILDLSRLPKFSKLIPTVFSNIDSSDFLLLMNIEQLSSMPVDVRTALYGKLGLRLVLDGGRNEKYHWRVLATLDELGISPPGFLILFDRGSVTPKNYSETTAIGECINTYIAKGYVNNIFSSGAFPASISNIIGQTYIDRADRLLWGELQKQVENELLFSDYGTINPDWDWKPGGGSPYSNIRYTIENSWYVLRDDQRGKESAIALAALLLMSNEYQNYGASFSWGDNSWNYKVANNDKPGNAMKHVAESLNHHIMHVLDREGSVI